VGRLFWTTKGMNVRRNNKDYEVFVAARLWGQLCSPNKIMVTIIK